MSFKKTGQAPIIQVIRPRPKQADPEVKNAEPVAKPVEEPKPIDK